MQVGGLQTTTLVIPANTVVEVDGNLEFSEALDPALVLQGDATFKLDPSATITWPVSFTKPESASVTIDSKQAGANWHRLLLPAGSRISLENFLLENGQIGVYCNDASYVSLSGFTIRDCSQYGIYMTNIDTLRLNESIIQNCVDYGIQVKFSSAFISQSTVASCQRGIYSTDCNLEIVDSQFNNNSISGVFLEGVESNAVIEYCSFDGNGYGLYNYSNRHLVFRRNVLLNQTDYPLHFPRPQTDENVVEQNNVLPGGSASNRLVLVREASFQGAGRYLDAGNNWWGTTDTTAIRSAISDGYHHADTDTVRIWPILTQAVQDAGPR